METEQKLRHFVEDIEARSFAELDGVAGEVGDEHREQTDRARAEAERRAQDYRRAELAALERRRRQALDERRAGHREELSRLRRQYAGRVLDAVRARVEGFTASPEYPKRLAALTARALSALGAGGDGAVVYLRREDMRHAEDVKRAVRDTPFTVEEGAFSLGGVIARTADGARRADLSFETALNDARERLPGELWAEGREPTDE